VNYKDGIMLRDVLKGSGFTIIKSPAGIRYTSPSSPNSHPLRTSPSPTTSSMAGLSIPQTWSSWNPKTSSYMATPIRIRPGASCINKHFPLPGFIGRGK
jgi:hypothetical protein